MIWGLVCDPIKWCNDWGGLTKEKKKWLSTRSWFGFMVKAWKFSLTGTMRLGGLNACLRRFCNTILQWTNRICGFLEQGSKATGSKIFTQSIDGVRKPLMELYPKHFCESAMRVWSLLDFVLKSKHIVSFKSWWDGGIFGRINALNGHVCCTWPTLHPNRQVNGRIVFFATRWQVREGYM
jgi:hypothetical protein